MTKNSEEPYIRKYFVRILQRVKLIIKKVISSELESIKVELSTEDDIFEYYNFICEKSGFELLSIEQDINASFCDFPSLLTKIFINLISEPVK